MSVHNSSSVKLTIFTLDFNGVPGEAVEAQYNPKEIAVNKSVRWQAAQTSGGDLPELSFTSGDGRSMSFELFFDTYERGIDVHAAYVAKLVRLAMVMDPDGNERKRMPTRVRILWGTGLPRFDGVIETIDTKYTMFLPSGVPVRATCTLRIKEADRTSFRRGA